MPSRIDLLLLRLRLYRLNRKPGVRIEKPGYIARSAHIDMDSDGMGVRGRLEIGAQARISHGALIAPYGGFISIGCNVFIGPYSVLYGHGGLSIGNDVLIAAHVTIIPANHGIEPNLPIAQQPSTAIGIRIEDDVWIGTGARILDGVTIGRGAIIGAGAVVTRSIPDHAIALGVPARVSGTRKRESR